MTPALCALVASLLVAGAPAPPSPAKLRAVSFFDEVFVKDIPDDHLETRGWPSLEFVSPGVVIVSDGETERVAFTATKQDKDFVLVVTNSNGKQVKKFWRWLDAERAVTDLWGDRERIASRRRPTPTERRDKAGEVLAARLLGTVELRDSRNSIARLRPDGGVQWNSGGRGTFFSCIAECVEDAGTSLCLRHGQPAREFMFVASDGGIVGMPVRQVDTCGAREPVAGERLEVRR